MRGFVSEGTIDSNYVYATICDSVSFEFEISCSLLPLEISLFARALFSNFVMFIKLSS